MTGITSPPADFTPSGEGAPTTDAPSVDRTETAPAAVPAVAPAAVEPEVDPFDSAPDDAKFDKKYVSKLREEAAARRTEAARYKEVYGDFSQEDQQAWFDMANAWKEDPAKAVEMMERIAAAVRGGATQEEAAAAVAKVEADPNQTLTPEAVQSMIDKAKTDWLGEQQLQDQTLKLVEQAETLGYKRGTPGYRDLFARAQYDHAGSLEAAHAAVQAEKQAIIDGFVASKGKTAGPAPVNQGAAPGTRTVPKTFEEASAAFRASYGAQAGQ